jgi:hypothetical protein
MEKVSSLTVFLHNAEAASDHTIQIGEILQITAVEELIDSLSVTLSLGVDF